MLFLRPRYGATIILNPLASWRLRSTAAQESGACKAGTNAATPGRMANRMSTSLKRAYNRVEKAEPLGLEWKTATIPTFRLRVAQCRTDLNLSSLPDQVTDAPMPRPCTSAPPRTRKA
jgi:hypothetical protein